MTYRKQTIQIQGAARQSWNKNNPRIILDQLQIDHPKLKNKTKLWNLFWDKVKGNTDVLKVIAEYWFANNTRIPVTFERKKEIKKVVDAIVSKAFMNFVLPNGMFLGEATKPDCLKAGGWLTKVGCQLPDDKKKVKEVLNEKQLKKLYDLPK